MRTYLPSTDNFRKKAFTLVELLVVITIIGILIALLLPAVQAARESARRLQCTNNLKQLALACLTHEETHGFLPTGGWGPYWAGDPDRGFTNKQPGGWLFNILPYMEQQGLYDLAITGDGIKGDYDSIKAERIKQVMQTPIAGFHCPSRRKPIVYPWGITGNLVYRNLSNAGVPQPQLLAQCDYAASCGQSQQGVTAGGPSSYADADNNWTSANWLYNSTGDPSKNLGVICYHSECHIADITDGASKTYLAGEKYLNPFNYENSMDIGTDQTWNHGCDWDVNRLTKIGGTYFPPLQDTPGYGYHQGFGSVHAVSFNMAFCDGSVHSISYSIDRDVHNYLGCRNDGVVIDAKEY